MENIVALILQKLNKPYTYIAKPKFGKSPEIFLGDFIYIVITNDVGSKDCKDYLDISEQTFNRLVKKLFPSVKLSGGGQTWAFYLLSLVDYKKCHKCGNILFIDNFYTNINHCKPCHSVKNKEYYQQRKDVWDTYYDKHKPEYLARNAKRRAVTEKATPKWANLAKIKQIYADCPTGYHVDHIIPLNGKHVCGLHVEHNLQYLSAEDNLKKSNKFE